MSPYHLPPSLGRTIGSVTSYLVLVLILGACAAPSAAPPAAAAGEAAAPAQAAPIQYGDWLESQNGDVLSSTQNALEQVVNSGLLASVGPSYIPWERYDPKALLQFSGVYLASNVPDDPTGAEAPELNAERSTLYLDLDAGALIEFAAVRQSGGDLQNSDSVYIGAWYVYQSTKIYTSDGGSVDLNPGQYAVLIEPSQNRFKLIGEEGEVAAGGLALRQGGCPECSYVYLTRQEVCFVFEVQACLQAQLTGFEASEKQIQKAVDELTARGALKDESVNTTDVFATILGSQAGQVCREALLKDEPTNCRADAVAAAIVSGDTSHVQPIGVLSVLESIDIPVMNPEELTLQKEGLPPDSYRLDLLPSQSEKEYYLAQLFGAQGKGYYTLARTYMSPIGGEIIQGSSNAEYSDHLVALDEVAWSYCDSASGHVKCRSGEWKWNLCLLGGC